MMGDGLLKVDPIEIIRETIETHSQESEEFYKLFAQYRQILVKLSLILPQDKYALLKKRTEEFFESHQFYWWSYGFGCAKNGIYPDLVLKTHFNLYYPTVELHKRSMRLDTVLGDGLITTPLSSHTLFAGLKDYLLDVSKSNAPYVFVKGHIHGRKISNLEEHFDWDTLYKIILM